MVSFWYQNGFDLKRMPNLTLKNIPDELYKRLKDSAARHRRSLNSEILVSLDRAVRSVRVDPEEFIARVDGLHRQMDIPFLTDEILRQVRREGRP